MCRFRVSSHELMIEKGRHSRPKVERTERKCPICKLEVGDECHFLTKCPLYNTNRLEFYTEIRKLSLEFDYLTNIQKTIYIMRNENTSVIKNLAKFVHECMKIRKEYMSQI